MATHAVHKLITEIERTNQNAKNAISRIENLILNNILSLFFFFRFRNGEAWYRIRQALAKKMLRLKEVHDNTDNWNDVIVDAEANFRSLRDSNNEVPDLTEQLFKWSTECE